MLLLGVHVLVELFLSCSVLLAAVLQTLLRLGDTFLQELLDVLDVVKQDFLCFLLFFLGACLLVQCVDFVQVVAFVTEELLRDLVCVLQVAVLAVVIRLGIQVVKQLNQAFMEL